MLDKLDLSNRLKLDLFAIVAVLMNCIFINIYAYEYKLNETEEILSLSITAYVICMSCVGFFIIRHYVPAYKISIVWTICLIYGISFLPTYTVLITGGKKYLLLNLSSSLLLLAMMTDWVMFMIVSITGLTFSIITFLVTHGDRDINFLHSSKKTYFIYYIMSYTFISVALFMRRKEKVQEKKMDFMKVFGSAIAHEVNAPLSAMKMMADALDSILLHTDTKKKAQNYILTINQMDYSMLTQVINKGMKKSASDAIQIVEMLLSAIREKYTKQKSQGKISMIIKEAIDLSAHLDPLGIRINTNIDDDFYITGNIKLLKHVIYNLIKNSFKHGGDNVEVLIEVIGNTVVVSDNGVGISEDKMNKIFTAFFTDGNGSGIGLAFSRFVLDDMNASIECESEVGSYTKFTIYFRNCQYQYD